MPSAVEEPLHVIVVGAGMGGIGCALACRRQGFKVTVFDQVPKFAPIGDSIGFGANTSRLLQRWGILEELEAIGNNAQFTQLRDWDGKELGRDPAQGDARRLYGYPSLICHRGELHEVLLKHLYASGAEVHVDAKVVDYDNDAPSVTLENGQVYKADVVIASDGVKSLGRKQVLGYFDKPIHSGYGVYRACTSSEAFKNDPLTKDFVNNGDVLDLWIGPDVHAFVITFRNGELINCVVTHVDDGDVEKGWMFPGKKEDVWKTLKGCDPRLRRVWEIMPEENILDWKLVFRPCLDKWIADSGKVAIMGDAAHPFLPSSSQGASQAVEDGATIAKCLAHAGKDNIALALHTYFEIRYEHVKKAQMSGISQRDKWHHNHDEEGKLVKEIDASEGVLDSTYLWSHDCEKVADEMWEEASKKVAARLAAEKTAAAAAA